MQQIQRVSGLVLRRPRVALVILVIIVGLVVLAYTRFGGVSPEVQAQKELAAAVAAVGELMILPEGDEPVLATVTDAEALTAQQAFFSGSVNGDQLLLFPRSLKAVIYSPSRNKIINAGPIEQQPGAVVDKSQTTNPKSQTDSTSSPQANSNDQNSNDLNTLTVEVRNGTDKVGYASQFADELRANAGYAVVKVDDAGRKDYQNTVVFVRTSDASKQSKIEALVSTLEAVPVETLPDGEKNTSADILVILANNQ